MKCLNSESCFNTIFFSEIVKLFHHFSIRALSGICAYPVLHSENGSQHQTFNGLDNPYSLAPRIPYFVISSAGILICPFGVTVILHSNPFAS